MSSTTIILRLNAVVERIRQQYDTRFLRRFRDITRPHERKIATGYASLDAALTIGGLPRGHVIEISGSATCGAATLVLQILAQAQQRGEQVAYMDCLQAFDADYAFRCGVDVDALVFVRPHSLSAALSITSTLALYGNVSVIAVDYLPALCEDDWAHMLGLGMRRLHPALHSTRATVLFLTDGEYDGLLAHDAALRLELRRQRWLRRQGDIGGVQTRVMVSKNKFGQTGTGASIQIHFPDDGL